MLSLYEILKASKTGIAPDMWTALAGMNWGGADSGHEVKELTGIPPLSFTADGTPLLDYLISGNMSQTGTPTPDNPIQPQETGERTGNLFDYSTIVPGYTYNSNGQMILNPDENDRWKYSAVPLIEVDSSETYLRTYNLLPMGNIINFYDNNKNFLEQATPGIGMPVTVPSNCKFVSFVFQTADSDVKKYMFTRGSTAPSSYIPYGYKIPISCGGTTTPVYLGEVQTERKIGKYDLANATWTLLNVDAGQYIWKSTSIPNIKYTSVNTEMGNGIAEKYTMHQGSGMKSAIGCIAIDVSQVSVNNGSDTEKPSGYFWYALDTRQTAVVNEPLRKIGDYADTLSYEQAGVQIPTNRGNTVIDVETELKPSEMYIKYQE